MNVTIIITIFRCSVTFVAFIHVFIFRHRIAEISFVLKAIATLLSSLKKAPVEKGMLDSISSVKQLL